MKKSVMIAVLLASAMSAQAKLGETREQILQRFGADALIAERSYVMHFVRKNEVIVGMTGNRSCMESYMLRTPYSARDADEIVRIVIGGKRRWTKIKDYTWRSTDGVYELVTLLPQVEYRWGIAVGYTRWIEGFLSATPKRDATQPQAQPTPPYYPDDPTRSPNDCAIVAAQAYKKLKPNTTWCKLVGVVWLWPDSKEYRHMVVAYKYEPHGQVFIYDASGAVELDTTSEDLKAIQPAYQVRLGSWRTVLSLRFFTEEEAETPDRGLQPSQDTPEATVTPEATGTPPATPMTTPAATPSGERTLLTLTTKQLNDFAEIVGVFAVVILFKMLIGGGIGYIIGRSKNRQWAGFWWGTAIGWIGWIITACMHKRELA